MKLIINSIITVIMNVVKERENSLKIMVAIQRNKESK